MYVNPEEKRKIVKRDQANILLIIRQICNR